MERFVSSKPRATFSDRFSNRHCLQQLSATMMEPDPPAFAQQPQQHQQPQQPQPHPQPAPPQPPTPITTQPIPTNDPSLIATLNQTLLPYSLYDVVLDIPYPGASSASPIELIYPPSDDGSNVVGGGVVDALAAEDLTAEFGPEDGTGGQGAAKIMRFAFPEFEDRVNAHEVNQRQQLQARFPSGSSPNLNRHDAYLEEISAPVNPNNTGGTTSTAATPTNSSGNNNSPSKSLPSYHVFSHRLANGSIIHGHVRRYLPYHASAGGRRDVGRRGIRALVLLTRNSGGGNRLYSALLKSLEILTLQSPALSQNVSAKGDTVMNASSGIVYRRWFMHLAFREHVNLCRDVASAMESGGGAASKTTVLAKPRILTLPLVEVGRGHGLFGSVDTIKLAVPSSFLHEREPADGSLGMVVGLSRNDMMPMLRCLGVARTMRLMSALMSERRVIMTSGNVSKLSAVTYGALAMMGQGLLPPPPVFVPVLPPGLVSLLQSPSSYLIGVLTGPTPHFINLRSVSGIGEVVLFDLDNSGNEPFFAGIANPQQAVPDLTRRNIDDFDSASRVSLPDVLYQDLSEVLKLDKRLFWQGAVQEKLGMAAEKGKAAAKNAMKKGLKYLKGKSKSKMEGKESAGAENGDDEEAEEDVGANNDSSLSKFVGKGNYCYDHGYSNEAAEVEARVAFTTFFVSILGDLRTYLTQQTPGVPPVVDKEKYMRYRNSQGDVPGTAMFLLCGNFLRGKLFNSFVEARLKEVQLRRVVPEDAPFFALATNFHRSNRVDFYVNNVRQSVRKVASNPDLPGRHLILWNDGIRRRVMELTSTQAFNGDAMKALSQLTEDCHECSSILIDTMMVLWTRMQEGKGMQWKKALLALQVFRNLLLNGPINIIAEAIDGFASIRILRSYTEALRGQNSVLIRDAATEIYSLVVDLPVLFARRRENMNRMRLVKDPKPSPLRKETRMIKGISQFRNVHIALKPAGATVAPAPPAVNDLLTQGVPSAPAAAPHSVSYSDDLLALGDVSSSPSPQVVATGNQGTANPFDMASLSQSTPSVGVKSAVSNVPSFMANTSDASSSQSTPLHMPPPTLSASAPVPSAQSMSQHPPQLAPLNTSLVPPSQSIPQLTPQQYSQQPMPHHQNRPYPMATGAINPSMSSGLASPPHSFAPGQFPNPNNGIASPLKQSAPNMAMQQRQHHAPVPQGANFPISHPHHPQMATQPPHNQPWGQPPPQFQHGMQGAPMVGANHYNHHPGVPNPNPNQPYNAQGGGVMQQPGQQQAPKPAFSQFDPLAR